MCGCTKKSMRWGENGGKSVETAVVVALVVQGITRTTILGDIIRGLCSEW